MKRTDGSVVVYIVIMTTVAFTILLGLLSQSSVIFSSTQERYYHQLAYEAAEAGAAYATSCLNLFNHVQTWGPNASGGARPNLTPETNCTGMPTSPSTGFVLDTGRVQTSFIVGNLDSSLAESALVSSNGFVFVKDSGGNTVKTYTHTLKKNIVWPGIYEAERSASGTYRTCAVLTGSVYCWGRNRYGQLGNGSSVGNGDIETSSSADSNVPVKVKQAVGLLAGKYVTNLFTAMYHSCALANGAVYCWGWNIHGQLGNGTSGNYSDVPVQVGGALSGKTVTAIGGSGNTSCAIADGKIYCWGLNHNGSTARGLVGVNNSVTTLYSTPQLVTAGNTSTTLPTNYQATKLTSTGSRAYNLCAIADDQAYCWGNNTRGAVGDDTTTHRLLPTKALIQAGVLQGRKIVDISLDGFSTTTSGPLPHVCVVGTDTNNLNGRVYCWGDNTYGQLGNNSTTHSSRPVVVRANAGDALFNKTVNGVAVGLVHSCVVATSEAFCWGRGDVGQIGNNSSASRYVPTAVSKLAGGLLNLNVVNIGGGSNRGCAITDDGRTFCWGRNAEGQIGDGTLVDRFIPTESLYLRPKTSKYYY